MVLSRKKGIKKGFTEGKTVKPYKIKFISKKV